MENPPSQYRSRRARCVPAIDPKHAGVKCPILPFQQGNTAGAEFQGSPGYFVGVFFSADLSGDAFVTAGTGFGFQNSGLAVTHSLAGRLITGSTLNKSDSSFAML